MERARSGILRAAADLVASGGSSAVTMSAVARRSAVAKATVYNHFRDRDELLRSLLATERAQLVAHCSALPQGEQLDAAATWLSASPVLAGLRRHDAPTLVLLADAATSDPTVRADVQRWCTPGADPDRALRWLLSFGVAPARSAQTGSQDEPAP